MSLLRVEVSPDRGTFRLGTDGPPEVLHTLLIDPPQLALDLPGVVNRSDVGVLDLDSGPVASLRVLAYEDGSRIGTRVIFNLRERAAPVIERADDGVRVRFGDGENAQGVAVGQAVPPPSNLSRHDEIGPEDLLEINVFELPELRSSVRVQGDGTISLPLLGIVQAAGLSEVELEARLKQLLEERYVKNPEVSVFVKQPESRKVSIIGALARPGVYPVLGERTLLQMLSEAGGLTADAGRDLLVIRDAAKEPGERIHVDLHRLVVLGDPELNLTVRPGDVINVLADRTEFIYLDGSIKNAGRIEARASRPITLLQAIARAGGTSDRANSRQVRVIRTMPDGSRAQLVFDVKKIRRGKAEDVYLQDGDIVIVPEALF